MPKLPRISGTECIKALQRLGFESVRQRGSHVVMRCGEKGCVVPPHKEIRTGTLAGILRQAEITADDFIRALND
ncbi:MAG: type II toxin-antitoxin system HicA family toxin [Verrucomicrobiae bacterium]|nr:type II toxin-antitoxin system HicA family toxin [Verrucomicrobiae bacterium]MCB1092409.1 type II toxin-antitoxin system HicA family toxin [Verrucomicrobiae bacterium]